MWRKIFLAKKFKQRGENPLARATKNDRENKTFSSPCFKVVFFLLCLKIISQFYFAKKFFAAQN